MATKLFDVIGWYFSVVMKIFSEILLLFFIPSALIFVLFLNELVGFTSYLILNVIVFLVSITLVFKSKKVIEIQGERIRVKNLLNIIVLDLHFSNVKKIKFNI